MLLFARNPTISYSLPLNNSILISKVTTIPIQISNNPFAIWGEVSKIQNYFQSHYLICILSMIHWLILIINKAASLKNGKSRKWSWYLLRSRKCEYAKKGISAITKKRNSAGWKLISTSTAIEDTKNQFSNLYLFWEKK